MISFLHFVSPFTGLRWLVRRAFTITANSLSESGERIERSASLCMSKHTWRSKLRMALSIEPLHSNRATEWWTMTEEHPFSFCFTWADKTAKRGAFFNVPFTAPEKLFHEVVRRNAFVTRFAAMVSISVRSEIVRAQWIGKFTFRSKVLNNFNRPKVAG